MPPALKASQYTLGKWNIDLAQRELRADGAAIPLGARAFEILELLVRSAGELVNKYDLMDRVWPGAIVEENTLQAHISALRRAFGTDRELLKTESGRGYRLLGTWAVRKDISEPLADQSDRVLIGTSEGPSSLPATNLPEQISELIGRDGELQDLLGLCATQRLVTLTGTGGIGKTRLAVEVARQMLLSFADGVWIVEFASLSEPDFVPVSVATALGITLTTDIVSPHFVARALASKHILLVLDNCEHLIDPVARLTELILQSNPALHVIATTREALRLDGERVYRVPPLAFPTHSNPQNEDPLRYGAVRLFAERARAADLNVAMDARVVALVSSICRQLDGIPLAIELAAARSASLGIEKIASGLDDRFRLLTGGGHRTALPRHQTLRGALNWSYELLTEPERVVFRRLAVFAGGFILEMAILVVADDRLPAAEVVDCIASLVAKSLVGIETSVPAPRHRFLETTRTYAMEQLRRAGEVDTLAARHAHRFQQFVLAAAEHARTGQADAEPGDHSLIIDNVRAALDWAFFPTGDAARGVTLTAAAAPLWMHLSFVQECRRRLEQALAAIEAGVVQDSRIEMELLTALTGSLVYSGGNLGKSRAAGARALEIAETLGDVDYQSRSLTGLWYLTLVSGPHRLGLTLAQRLGRLAATRPDVLDDRSSSRMAGISHYYLGELREAQHHLERVPAHYVAPVHKWQVLRSEADEWVVSRSYLARSLWLRGFPDQALRAAEGCVAEAQAMNHAVSFSMALVIAACPIASWAGDLSATARYVEMLLECSRQHALGGSHIFGRCFQALHTVRRGQARAGTDLLRAIFAESETGSLFSTLFANRLAEGLCLAGDIIEGLQVIEDAIAAAQQRNEFWQTAEEFRIRAQLLSMQGAATAEAEFQRAIDLANRQGALSWELRATIGLAQSLHGKKRRDAIRARLIPVYGRFTEGFETGDLKAARLLIEEVS